MYMSGSSSIFILRAQCTGNKHYNYDVTTSSWVNLVSPITLTTSAHFARLNRHFNPLTTDDAFSRRLTLTTCYQLAQSVLKIGFGLAKRVGQGKMGGFTPLVAVGCRKALVNDRWAICLLSCINGCRKRSFHLVGTPFLAF